MEYEPEQIQVCPLVYHFRIFLQDGVHQHELRLLYAAIA